MKHLSGLMHLLILKGSSARAVLPSFFTQYFSFHYILARTVLCMQSMDSAILEASQTLETCAQKNDLEHNGLHRESLPDTESPNDPRSTLDIENSAITIALSRWMDDANRNEINTYKGLSDSLLLLINQITDLQIPTSRQDICNHYKNTSMLKKSITQLPQQPPANVEPETRWRLCASAKVYQYACLLYLYQKVASIRASIPVRTMTLNPLFSDMEVQTLVDDILELCETNNALLTTAAVPLWPLFIAGCSTVDELARVRTLSLLKQTENLKRFGVRFFDCQNV